MTTTTTDPRPHRRRGSRGVEAVEPWLTALLGALFGVTTFLSAAGSASTAAGPLGPVGQVSACATHRSASVQDLEVKVTKTKPLGTKLLSIKPHGKKTTVKLRVTVAVTATNTAVGTGKADACPGDVSNPKTITKTVTWAGTKTATATKAAIAPNLRQAKGHAVKAATNQARIKATRATQSAAATKAEATVQQLAWAASNDSDLPTDPGPDTPPTAAELEQFRQWIRDDLVELTNDARTTAALPTLTSLAPLTARAQGYAQAGADAHPLSDFGNPAIKWSHSPSIWSGDVPGLEVCSGNDGGIGENLAHGAYGSVALTQETARYVAERLQKGWFASPGHKQQLLWPTHTRMGVGVGIKLTPEGRLGLEVLVQFYGGSCPEIPS
ncbi:hypothetical protein GCM10009795_096930 [Nocardioides hankookensis]|uniref:CAP domain-containing protein n=1 Tax=Nocardioides hankookensis TaxID=443157 RepID=A0ABW1LLK9_9ACTN